jgi:MFS family permease
MTARSTNNPLMMAILAGGLVVSVAMGIRQAFGLFLTPFSFDYGLPVTTWAFAIALHNLVWGVTQPFVGAATDRYGAPIIIVLGAVVYCAGLALVGFAPSAVTTIIGVGVLVGFGLSCMSFGVVLGAIGRAASPQQRSSALGLATAVGSIGQFLIPLLAQWLIDRWNLNVAFVVLAAVALIAIPFGLPLKKTSGQHGGAGGTTSVAGMITAVRAALGDRNYLLLTIGFFTCGFQLAFISTHLPGYLVLCHLPVGWGATALAVIGFANMVGSWLCGQAGARWRPQNVLGWIYLARAAALCAFLLLPKTPAVVLLFSVVMGVTWLGTVPLTNHVIARLHGVGNLGMLFGGCFLSHQIGSFLGAWLGGLGFELTGSYDVMWALTAVAGVFAAVLHFPIRDRLATQSAAA